MDDLELMDDGQSGTVSAANRAHLRQIVEQARARLRDGDAHSALQAVLVALQHLGGEQAAMPAVQQVREALGRGQGPQANNAVQQIGQLLEACSLSAQTQQPQASLTPPQQHDMQLQPHPRNPQQLPEHGAHDWQLHPGRPPGDAARGGAPLQQHHGGRQQVDSITAGLRDTMLDQRPPELQMGDGTLGMGQVPHTLATELGQNSFVCPRCGGVVSQARCEAHERLWCPALQH